MKTEKEIQAQINEVRNLVHDKSKSDIEQRVAFAVAEALRWTIRTKDVVTPVNVAAIQGKLAVTFNT